LKGIPLFALFLTMLCGSAQENPVRSVSPLALFLLDHYKPELQNPAISICGRPTLMLHVHNHFGISDLNSLIAQFDQGEWRSNFSGRFAISGLPGYRNGLLQIAYSLQTGSDSRVGAQLGMIRSGLKALTPTLALGIQWRAQKQQSWGISAFLPVATASPLTYNGIPAVLRIDHNIEWADRYYFVGSLSIDSHSGIKPELKLCARYEAMDLAFGTSLAPFVQSFALLYNLKLIKLGIGLNYTSNLGYSPSILLLWQG
jgi:hypothetical protein